MQTSVQWNESGNISNSLGRALRRIALHPRKFLVTYDVEEDRHVHLLVRVQPLFFKAKALDLVEVLTRIVRDDIVSANSIAKHATRTPKSML